MTKTDETFQEAVAALRAWLDFLNQKESEYQDQLERARRKAEKEASEGSVMVVQEEEEASQRSEPAADEMPEWL